MYVCAFAFFWGNTYCNGNCQRNLDVESCAVENGPGASGMYPYHDIIRSMYGTLLTPRNPSRPSLWGTVQPPHCTWRMTTPHESPYNHTTSILWLSLLILGSDAIGRASKRVRMEARKCVSGSEASLGNRFQSPACPARKITVA